MTAPVESSSGKSAARLFRQGAEVCEVVAFRPIPLKAHAVGDPPRIPAVCCFTVPLSPAVDPDDTTDYELVFDNGARLPIRIRDVLIRLGGALPAGRDVFAELI